MPNGRTTITSRATVDERSTAGSSGAGHPALALTIAYHPRLDRVGERFSLEKLSADKPLALSRVEPMFAPPGTVMGEPLGDDRLSRKPIYFCSTSDGGVRIDVGDSGTSVSVGAERIAGSLVFSAKDLARGVVLGLGQRIVVLLHRSTLLDNVPGPTAGQGEREIIGESDGIRRVLWEIHSVADLDLPVLLRGETGSGKELVARDLHLSSRRSDKPFVAVNLGAITPSLAIAELFGAEKGAYTGSLKRQVGYFEQAAGGTLFLDEIGEAPVELQVALLRAIETKEVQTVGAPQPRKIDVRIVAATDADLENKVATGSFRAPLLNRLAAYEISIPPLRQRRDDIGRLFVRFLGEEMAAIGESGRLDVPSGDAKPWLAASIVAQLIDYDWPGNIRQLRNVVRQLVIGNRGRARAEMTPAVERLLAAQPLRAVTAAARIELAQTDNPPGSAAVAETAAPSVTSGAVVPKPQVTNTNRRKPADITENELREALRACRWELNETAERLGISRASMYNLNERFSWFRVAGDLSEQEIRQCFAECGGDVGRVAERLEVSEKALRRRLREFELI